MNELISSVREVFDVDDSQPSMLQQEDVMPIPGGVCELMSDDSVSGLAVASLHNAMFAWLRSTNHYTDGDQMTPVLLEDWVDPTILTVMQRRVFAIRGRGVVLMYAANTFASGGLNRVNYQCVAFRELLA